MADEWVCEECGHTSPIDPGSESCPECGKKMKKIDDFDDELAGAKDDTYDDDAVKTPIDDEDLEVTGLDEDEVPHVTPKDDADEPDKYEKAA